MEKITHISDEQKARMPDWVEKWVAIGLSTEPMNFDIAKDSVLQMYDIIGKKRPTYVLRVDSPQSKKLNHQEHSAHDLLPGVYVIKQQTEEWLNEVRPVMD